MTDAAIEIRSHNQEIEILEVSKSDTSADQPKRESRLQQVLRVINEQYFIFGALLAVCVAAAYPPLGRADGPINPSITTGFVAVAIIFLISGLTLRSSELKDAILYVKFHAYVQFSSFVFIPAVVFGVATLLRLADFNPALVDGLIIMSCMPTGISMCVVFAKSAGGNEATALFNSTVGNLMGIVITPLLLLLLVNANSSISFAETILQLVYKALIPLVGGQIIRYMPVRHVQPLLQRYKQPLKRISETMLILIIYTTFANMFYEGTDASPVQIVVVLVLALVLFCSFAWLAWISSGWACMNIAAEDRITAVFTISNKTAAMGIPLINTIYADSDNLGLYIVPLLLYYSCQLLIGSFLTSVLRKWMRDQQSSCTN